MSKSIRKIPYQKINTKGKFLNEEMKTRLAKTILKHRGFLILIAKEQAQLHNIPIEFKNRSPIGWFADLVSAGIYGMCRGGLAWQQKKIEGLKTTTFDGELKQAARVRVKQLAVKISKHCLLF